MFKSGMRGVKGRRSSAATDIMPLPSDAASSDPLDNMPLPPSSSHHHNHPEFLYLHTPNLPFDPEFHTSFATLTDVLVDAYTGVIQLLNSPETMNAAVADAFAKADKLTRKILVQSVVQEFGETTRKEIKGEVSGLGKVVLSGLM